MQVIRKILKGRKLKSIIDIPSNLLDKNLKLLIIPIEEEKENKNKKSLAGFLSQYANSSLINREENV